MDIFNFGDFVKQLQTEGFDARGDVFNGQVGVIVGPKGLDVNRMPHNEIGIFHPLWEINDPRNQQLVAERRFHDIAEKRQSGWTPFRDR